MSARLSPPLPEQPGAGRPRRLSQPLRHRWRLTPKEAARLQEKLRSQLVVRGGPRRVRLVAGADAAYLTEPARCLAVAVVLRLPQLELIEEAVVERPVSFPYVPGLLSFREGPAVLAAVRRLHNVPELIIFDGHGLAHPRRFGLASHLGLLLGIPAVGCAKSLLVGEHEAVGRQAGSWSWLVHQGRRLGMAVRTQTGVRPVYVSPGHLVGFRAALRLVLQTVGRYRLAEPTRLADILVARAKAARSATRSKASG